MLVEYVKDNYYARFHDPSYYRYRGNSLVFTPREILTKSMEHGMKVKGTVSWCMLVEYVKDNKYARLYNPSYQGYRLRNFSVLLDVKF